MINTRQELIEYGLRKLGAPVLQISIAPEQIEDRLDEAIQFYQEYHSEAIEKTLFKHQITASQVVVSDVVGEFAKGETVTAAVSQTTFSVYGFFDSKIRTLRFNGTPIVGETITAESGATAVIDSVFIGDTQNRYITVPDEIMSVLKIFPYNANSTANYMFDARYQLMMSEIYNLNQSGLNYYYSVQQHVNMINFLLNSQGMLRFNRKKGRIYMDTDWSKHVMPDLFLLFEVYASIDPSSFGNTLNDIFLKKYFVALLKQQWAQNLWKYKELELPGGVKLNADSLMSEAREELKELEETVLSKYSAPLSFFVG